MWISIKVLNKVFIRDLVSVTVLPVLVPDTIIHNRRIHVHGVSLFFPISRGYTRITVLP